MEFALAIHEERGKYGVTVPDLPGCFAAGDSFDEALADARGAIDAHVETLIEDGAGVPEVRSIDEHRKNPDFAGAIWGFIAVPVERYFGPAEKINITVPKLTLQRIDEFASNRGESRSAFLVSAAQQLMYRPVAEISGQKKKSAFKLVRKQGLGLSLKDRPSKSARAVARLRSR